MKRPRRDKMRIYGDLLLILNEYGSTEKIVPTRVQLRIKVSFDRLKNYFAELRELGLIQDETSLRLTDKGKQYLKEYQAVLDFMERMGLTYRRKPQ